MEENIVRHRTVATSRELVRMLIQKYSHVHLEYRKLPSSKIQRETWPYSMAHVTSTEYSATISTLKLIILHSMAQCELKSNAALSVQGYIRVDFWASSGYEIISRENRDGYFANLQR